MFGGRRSDETAPSGPENGSPASRVQSSIKGIMTPFLSCWAPALSPTDNDSTVGGRGGACCGAMDSDVRIMTCGDMRSRQQAFGEVPTLNILGSNGMSPHDNDVLCGRGGSSNRHIGNHNFRSLVTANKDIYVTLTKKQKMNVARSIVDTVKNQDPNGRFLQKDPATGMWFDIGLPRSLEKTSQALREKPSSYVLVLASAPTTECEDKKSALNKEEKKEGDQDNAKAHEKDFKSDIFDTRTSVMKKAGNGSATNPYPETPAICIPEHLEKQFNPSGRKKPNGSNNDKSTSKPAAIGVRSVSDENGFDSRNGGSRLVAPSSLPFRRNVNYGSVTYPPSAQFQDGYYPPKPQFTRPYSPRINREANPYGNKKPQSPYTQGSPYARGDPDNCSPNMRMENDSTFPDRAKESPHPPNYWRGQDRWQGPHSSPPQTPSSTAMGTPPQSFSPPFLPPPGTPHDQPENGATTQHPRAIPYRPHDYQGHPPRDEPNRSLSPVSGYGLYPPPNIRRHSVSPSNGYANEYQHYPPSNQQNESHSRAYGRNYPTPDHRSPSRSPTHGYETSQNAKDYHHHYNTASPQYQRPPRQEYSSPPRYPHESAPRHTKPYQPERGTYGYPCDTRAFSPHKKEDHPMSPVVHNENKRPLSSPPKIMPSTPVSYSPHTEYGYHRRGDNCESPSGPYRDHPQWSSPPLTPSSPYGEGMESPTYWHSDHSEYDNGENVKRRRTCDDKPSQTDLQGEGINRVTPEKAPVLNKSGGASYLHRDMQNKLIISHSDEDDGGQGVELSLGDSTTKIMTMWAANATISAPDNISVDTGCSENEETGNKTNASEVFRRKDGVHPPLTGLAALSSVAALALGVE